MIFEPHPLDAWAEQTAGDIEAMRSVDPKRADLMDECAASYLRAYMAGDTT